MSKVIVIGPVMEAKNAVTRGCSSDLHISSELLWVDNIAMAVQKGSLLKQILDVQWVNLNVVDAKLSNSIFSTAMFVEMGLYEYWKNKVTPELPGNSTGLVHRCLTMDDFISIHLVCTCSFLLSKLLFLFEIVIAKFSTWTRKIHSLKRWLYELLIDF